MGADVADCGETGAECKARIFCADNGLARNRNPEARITMVAGSPVRCVCTSIRPGRHVLFERSIAMTPLGSLVAEVGPTEMIVPEASNTTVWSLSMNISAARVWEETLAPKDSVFRGRGCLSNGVRFLLSSRRRGPSGERSNQNYELPALIFGQSLLERRHGLS